MLNPDAMLIAQRIARRPGFNAEDVMRVWGRPNKPPPKGSNPVYEPDKVWEGRNIVSVNTSQLPGWPPFPTPNGLQRVSAVRVHREVADVLVATWRIVVARNLHTTLRTYDGAQWGRWIRGRPGVISMHAFGCAIDFDAQWNRMGRPPTINLSFVRTMEELGWTWGGRWTGSNIDPMHFQWTDPLNTGRLQPWQDYVAGGLHGHKMTDITLGEHYEYVSPEDEPSPPFEYDEANPADVQPDQEP